ncbi:MAG: hypothetical protein Q9M36_02940 [Sulfurovum sp.]|nr:hypothetical protein [Sulfurovum sp.]
MITGVNLSGAMTGAGIDLVFAGHTLFVRWYILGLLLEVRCAAYFGFQRIPAEIKVSRTACRYIFCTK